MSNHNLIPTTTNNNLQTTANQILLQAQGTYIAKIRRNQPTALVFLIDQSGSMDSGELTIDGIQMSKAQAAARIVNATLNELISKATRDGEIRNYIDFAIIGYGAKSHESALLWSGNLTGKTWVKTQELAENGTMGNLEKMTKLPDGTTRITTKPTKTWFEPVAENLTPMHHALTTTQQLLTQWIANGHQHSFPPVVINITDGAATDAQSPQLIAIANQIKQLKTTDGQVLLLNCHLSDTEGESVMFPNDLHELPNDDYANCLFEMSSFMPHKYTDDINKAKETTNTQPYKGMCFNADGSRLIRFITIGSSY